MLTLFGAIWNVLLLAFTCGVVFLLLHRFRNRKWKEISVPEKIYFVFLFVLFLLFFPNIPYIFTDVRHILDHCFERDYYKLCPEAPWALPILFTYSALAIPFFVLIVRKIARLLGGMFHPLLQQITPLILIPLSALGVLLGLFERFNSWNIVSAPLAIFETAFSYFSEPPKFALWLIYSACFLEIFYFFEYFFAKEKS